MASVLASFRPSPNPNPNPLRLSSLLRALPLISFPSPARILRISTSSNWRRAPRAAIPDEWSESSEEEEEEAPSPPDQPMDEDEWGRDLAETVNRSSQPEAPASASDEDGDLKRCLVDSLSGTELLFRTSRETRSEILELVHRLEAANPIPAPTERPDLLDGNWILLFTTFSEIIPLLRVGSTPLLKVKQISRSIDYGSMTIVNAATVTSPFATFSFSTTASFEVRSPSRIQYRIKEGTLQPPEISSTVDLPASIHIFGQKVDLSHIQKSLNPVQEAAASIKRKVSGQPPLKIPVCGDGDASWLMITYLDEDFKIARADRGLFIFAKEGSHLLDQHDHEAL